MDLNKIALLAAKIIDIQRPALISAIDNSMPNSFQSEIIKRIEALTTRLNQFTNHGNKSRSHGRGRSRTRSKSPWPNNNNKKKTASSDDANKTCFYHRRFGSQARICRSPCDMSSRVDNLGN